MNYMALCHLIAGSVVEREQSTQKVKACTCNKDWGFSLLIKPPKKPKENDKKNKQGIFRLSFISELVLRQ